MIDPVTIVFRDELPVLKAQAQSVNLYFRNFQTRSIYVIVNDEDWVADKIDPAWWGDFASLVRIIPRSCFSTIYVENGWVSQQALKLIGAALSYNTWSVLLDAKTIFSKQPTEVFDSQGRVRSKKLDVFPVFEPSRQITNKLFGIDLPNQIGPGGVPFLMKNSVVRQMISHVEELTQQSFPEWFQQQGMLTEFILYSGYVYYKFKNFESVHNTDSLAITNVNIADYQVDLFEEKFKDMQNVCTTSIHRRAWAKLTHQQQKQYIDFLDSKGIKL